METPRILHVPIDLGGHASGLAAAERELGYNSACVSLYPSMHSSAEVEVQPSISRFGREIQRTRLFARALLSADEVHYHFGETLIMPRRFPVWRSGHPSSAFEWLTRVCSRLAWMADVPLLSLLRKRIAFHFYGDDIRRKDYSLAHFPVCIAREVGGDYYPAGTDELKAVQVQIVRRWATRIFAYNPDLLHLLPASARFLPYTHLDVRSFPRLPRAPRGRVLQISHAPTNPTAKGSRFLIAAVKALSQRGVAIELDLILNASHAETLRRIGMSDVFVDQLLAGWYGGAGVEAMIQGVATVAYIREDDLHVVPTPMRFALPVIRATPTTIDKVLENLALSGSGYLEEIGSRSRDYVMQYHDPMVTAALVRKTMDDARASSDTLSARSKQQQ